MKRIRGKKITFRQYLAAGDKGGTFGDTPEADFASDASCDKNFRDFTGWEELRFFLVFYRATPEAIEAAQNLFKRWKADK